ncbi:MAG: hypothetical protein FJX71_04495 [Alphaproteobacteria bacterium]|nr:hypothetical protein [Alphaproteobacteria bacterium]
MVNFIRQIRQDLYRTPQSILQVLFVFLNLMIAFGLLSSNHPDLWQAFLPILLIGLSCGIVSLSLDQLFREDWEDGSIEWLMSEGKSIEIYILARIITHWLRLGIPLVLFVGLISGFASYLLLFGVATATLTLMLLGAVGSALCLNTSANNAILLPLLTLPLGIPIMIVSMGSLINTSVSGGAFPYFLLQGGLLLIACALSLVACPFALRLSLR